MTLSNYNSNENADFNSGEMILSNYDFNETANYEPSESEDIYILIPDITSMICDHIIMKFYYRKYILKKKIKMICWRNMITCYWTWYIDVYNWNEVAGLQDI